MYRQRRSWREEVFGHPQVTANNMLTVQDHAQAGQVEMVNIPIHLSETPGRIRRPAPLMGEHADEVLAELGYDDSRIRRLKDQNIIV